MGRKPGWFEQGIFCSVWGLLWEILPYFSVYMVGVMSISRLIVLISPLLQLNSRLMLWLTGGYGSYLVLRSVIPVSLNLAAYVYDRTDVFCFEIANRDKQYSAQYWQFNTISRLLQLAFPVCPIILSSVGIVSTLFVLSRRSRKHGVRSAHGSRATVTVLIFTGVYVVCNLPGSANYLLMVLALKDGCVDECYHHEYKQYPVLIWFSWNFTYVMCVVLNAALNPLIYAARIPGFKGFLKKLLVGLVKRCRLVSGAGVAMNNYLVTCRPKRTSISAITSSTRASSKCNSDYAPVSTVGADA